MIIELFHYNFRLLQNEVDSLSDRHFLPNQIDELLNIAIRNIVRKYVHKINDETAQSITDGIQPLIETVTLTKTLTNNLYSEFDLPNDFYYFKRATITANGCKLINVSLYFQDYVQHALTNFNLKPDFDWGRAVGFIANGKLTVYSNNEFSIDNASLTYIRKPAEVSIGGYNNINNVLKPKVECDLPEILHDLIIREAIVLAKGSVEDQFGFQVSDKLGVDLT